MSYPNWNQCVRLCHRRSPKSANFKLGDLRWNNWIKCWLASSGLLLQKNDSCWDTIWESRRWAPSYCWSIQNMAALLRRLQTWGLCPYRPQQLLLFHGYEKFELQTSPLDSKTFSISLSNRLPLGQDNEAADTLSRYLQRSPEEEDTLRSKNVKILYHLQSSLAKVFGLSTSQLSPLHQIFIYGITVFLRLNQFWNSFRGEITLDSLYIANIGGMRLRLSKLQENDEEMRLLRSSASLPEG